MKVIPLKNLEASDRNPAINYKAQTTLFLAGGGVEGLTVDQVRKSLKLIEEFEKADDTWTEIHIEDEQHSFLMMRIEAARWSYAHKNLLEWIDDITHAKARSANDHETSNN